MQQRQCSSCRASHDRFWYQHYRQTLNLKRCAHLHAAVAQAIAEGKPDMAANASDQLIDYMSEFTRSSI